MSHAPEEAGEITSGSDGLELNLGATEYFESMRESAAAANAKGIPILVDPVGVSGSSFRRGFMKELIDDYHPSVIRGNRAEIMAVLKDEKTETGVDSFRFKDGTDDDELLLMMQRFCIDKKKCYEEKGIVYSPVLICSGSTDLISSPYETEKVIGGSAMMTGVTGTGCMSSVVLSAFLAGADIYNKSVGDSGQSFTYFSAVLSGIRYINHVSEKAEENVRFLRLNKPLPNGNYGSGTFRMMIMDMFSAF